jgi:UDP-glucose:(heptosyl)LPS alpha-1,3-glucosyltransferase
VAFSQAGSFDIVQGPIVKVALICKKFSPNYGGLEKYSLFLGRELVRAGHEVHVFATQWQKEPGVSIHPVPIIPFSSPLKNLSFAHSASRAARQGEFDVVHSMERVLHQDIFRVSDGINPVQMKQRYPSPGIRWFKSKGPRRLVLQCLERRIFLKGGCKVVMANSNLVKRQIIEHYEVRPEKIVVIYNGVDLSRFHPEVKEKYRSEVRNAHGLSEQDLVLLFVSNDFRLKDLHSLLKAMVWMGGKKTKLMVLGSDKTSPYENFVKRNGLEGQVLFLGPTRKPEMFYGASDVLVLPTRYDAFANVCLEAMASGLPVITSTNNGAVDLIQDGANGSILESRDPRELARRISDLASRDMRQRIGMNASQTAQAYSLRRHVSEVLNLYDRIISTGER